MAVERVAKKKVDPPLWELMLLQLKLLSAFRYSKLFRLTAESVNLFPVDLSNLSFFFIVVLFLYSLLSRDDNNIGTYCIQAHGDGNLIVRYTVGVYTFIFFFFRELRLHSIRFVAKLLRVSYVVVVPLFSFFWSSYFNVNIMVRNSLFMKWSVNGTRSNEFF